ncbi:hypothetical protein [Amycolatopsis sp. FDAARGOS 1241]|uniref:hypothetical protein n=1 Tax=Amycolatopsis sp. FDAARGOS 1241 TaxID=2778070 RepID=UPI001EF2F480|nr:hypothetical protein [Amycolatopsis sp. FDAARGOS 1241]
MVTPADHVRSAPGLALTVDVCDVATGLVRAVTAGGRGDVPPFDVPRWRRKLTRYLGPDEDRWDPRFRAYLHDPVRRTVWVRLTPQKLRTQDLSYEVSSTAVPRAG